MSAVVSIVRFRDRELFELRRAIADGDPDCECPEDALPLTDRIALALERYQAEPKA